MTGPLAWHALAEGHVGLAMAVARRLAPAYGLERLADELESEALVVLTRAAIRHVETGSAVPFRAYLIWRIRRLAMDWSGLRRPWGKGLDPEAIGEPADHRDGPEAIIERADTAARLRLVLGDKRDPGARVLKMRHGLAWDGCRRPDGEGMNLDDVAARLKLRGSRAKKRAEVRRIEAEAADRVRLLMGA